MGKSINLASGLCKLNQKVLDLKEGLHKEVLAYIRISHVNLLRAVTTALVQEKCVCVICSNIYMVNYAYTKILRLLPVELIDSVDYDNFIIYVKYISEEKDIFTIIVGEEGDDRVRGFQEDVTWWI